jgi:hypothetical protein
MQVLQSSNDQRYAPDVAGGLAIVKFVNALRENRPSPIVEQHDGYVTIQNIVTDGCTKDKYPGVQFGEVRINTPTIVELRLTELSGDYDIHQPVADNMPKSSANFDVKYWHDNRWHTVAVSKFLDSGEQGFNLGNICLQFIPNDNWGELSFIVKHITDADGKQHEPASKIIYILKAEKQG